MQVVKMAYEIISMHEKIQQQSREITELMHYRDEYFKLLDADIKHGQHMMGGLMELVLTPGVSEALAKARG